MYECTRCKLYSEPYRTWVNGDEYFTCAECGYTTSASKSVPPPQHILMWYAPPVQAA